MDRIVVLVLGAVLITAIVTDLQRSKIPNWLTFPTMGVGIMTHAWSGGFPGAFFSLEGLFVGFGLFLFLHICNVIGAGDVKLMAAVGAVIGPYGALVSALLAMLVGGVYALGAMCYQWGVIATGRKLAYATQVALLSRGEGWAQELKLPFHLRYGLAIVGGTLLFQFGFDPIGG